MKDAKIRVLVIDDSLFMRTLISDILNSDPEITVIDTAKDGEEAIKKIPKVRPDCITLDLAMPGWDGLTTLEHIMDEYPTPVIILSAHSKKDADITIKCLNAGAVGFVLKPSGELSLDIESVRQKLLEEVKAASKVDLEKVKPRLKKKPKTLKGKLVTVKRIVVIGASTGGPQTLETILYSLPVNLPLPVIIVQHVPSIFFTESLAEHLNKMSDLEVKVAKNGEILRRSCVYLAPSGFQMTLETRIDTDKKMRIDTDIRENPPIKSVCIRVTKARPNSLNPSIDVTMQSAAEIYNGGTIGIILTGMGRDGEEGMRAIKEAGGKTIVQDESSLIFGMPKAVIDAGIADRVLPVETIAEAMMECMGV